MTLEQQMTRSRSPAQPLHAVFVLQGTVAADTHPDFILYSRKDIRQIGGGSEAVCDFYVPFSFYFFNGTETLHRFTAFPTFPGTLPRFRSIMSTPSTS